MFIPLQIKNIPKNYLLQKASNEIERLELGVVCVDYI